MPMALEEISARLDQVEIGPGRTTKHRRLSEAILSLVEEGRFQPGDRLPTETELEKALPFSLGTIQKALRTLSELGVVDRRTGRGTQIAERSGEIFDIWQFRFVDRGTGEVFPVYSRVLQIDRIVQRGPWSAFLGEEASYVRIAREIDVDRRYRLVSNFYLSNSRFGAMADVPPGDLEGVHLSAVLRRRFGAGTVSTKNRIVCTALPDPVCLALNLPSGARGTVCDILGFAEGGTPLTFQQTFVPADTDPLEFRELRPA